MERLDRSRHRRVHLPCDRTQLQRIETLVRHDERERRVPRTRLGRWVVRACRGDDLRGVVPPALRIAVAAHDLPGPIDDPAVRVHDGEDRHACLADDAERGALSRELSRFAVPRGRGAARAVCAQREHAGPQSSDRGAAELFVRIYRVLAAAVVEDDRAGDERDLVPFRGVPALREQLRRHTGRCLEPATAYARKTDRVRDREVLPIDARRATAHIDLHRCVTREVEHGAARWAFGVFGDTDLETWEVELEHALRADVGARYGMELIVADQRTLTVSRSADRTGTARRPDPTTRRRRRSAFPPRERGARP